MWLRGANSAKNVQKMFDKQTPEHKLNLFRRAMLRVQHPLQRHLLFIMANDAIRLGDLEICLLEVGNSQTPAAGDVRLGVSVAMDSFAGSYDQVWIAADEWRTFISSLRQLEYVRRGEAAVESMSPDEFVLRLQIMNAAGRLAVSGCLSIYHFGHPSGRTTRSRIEYHFGLDPSMLRVWVEAFASLSSSDV